MVRSTYVIVALLIPAAGVARTAPTTNFPGLDRRTLAATRSPYGGNIIEVRQAPTGSAVPLTGIPPRDTRPATGTSVVRGRVIDASSGTPLRKASVRIFSPDIREVRTTMTDVEGRYEFSDLSAGQFNLSANKTGYVDVAFGQAMPSEIGKPLKVGDKQVIEKIDFSLPRGAVVTGRVLDEYGEPIADVQVSALRNQFTANGPRPINAGRMATTNDIGEFRLFGIPPGQYFLSASFRNGQFSIGPTTGDTSGYALTYYPGTPNLADAQKLTLGLGGSVSDITLMLVVTRTARISGTVFDSQGQPVRQGSVMLMSRNASAMMPAAGGLVRPDGTFSISGVSPGEYTVRGNFPGPPQPGTPMEMAVATLTVNGVDITDVRVEPARPITVTGHVILDPVAARSFKPATMRLNAPPSEPGLIFGPPPPGAAIRDDLTFEFKASPGSSVVRLMSPQGWMIKSVFWNGSDVTDGITFRNEDVSGLEVELTNRVPDLSGLVTNARGDQVADYFAIAFPQDQNRWNAPGAGRIAMARPDDQGRYSFRSLQPGNYYVVAVEHLQTGEWMDPAFMDSVRSQATRVSLNEGDTQVLDLKLLQGR
jgi:protocatechuate 3,4-dioxygenase beta subunit